MKNLLCTLTILIFSAGIYAAEGDTTVVRSHDKQHMKFPPGNRDYVNRAKFPDGTKSYHKIILAYTLGCPNTGCSTWDYDTHVALQIPTGMMDSTLVLYPKFKVDNVAPDSFYISISATYHTFFNSTLMITDSTMSDTVLVEQFNNFNNPTTVTNSFNAYETGYYKYYYNTLGAKIDSVYETGDSIWHQTYHNKYNVFEVINTIEIARLITPYGDNSNVGYYPYTYNFDITDYAPILKDSVDVLLRFAGWQDGFVGTLDFIFVEGTPPRTPKRVLHLYDGYYAYGNVSNPINNNLVPYNLKLNSGESLAQLDYTVTGHGADNSGCSEFCAREYYVKVDGSLKYTQAVWKDDCGMNPIYPQGGTWIYDRANWCPGLPGYTYHHNLSPFVNQTSNKAVKVDFQSHTAAGGSPGYSISGNIITYGAANFTNDAGIERIISPNNNMLEGRYNPICGKPKIVVKNTGSQNLTSLKITYGPVGGSMSEYDWTGNLKFLETEEVELPQPSWARSEETFVVTVSLPNSNSDENALNNTLTSKFDLPDQLPGNFRIMYKTNNRSSTENRLTIRNSAGQEVYARKNVQNNVLYQDTLNLPSDCYSLKLVDEGKDGLEFWAGSQTVGYLRLHEVATLKSLKTFEPDFGTEINYQFVIGNPLGVVPANQDKLRLFIYPNPTKGSFYIDGLTSNSTPIVQIFDQLGRSMNFSLTNLGDGRLQIETTNFNLGIYTVRVILENEISTQRIIID